MLYGEASPFVGRDVIPSILSLKSQIAASFSWLTIEAHDARMLPNPSTTLKVRDGFEILPKELKSAK